MSSTVRMTVGPPSDSDAPDVVVLKLRTANDAKSLYARLKLEAERMEATGAAGGVILEGRLQ